MDECHIEQLMEQQSDMVVEWLRSKTIEKEVNIHGDHDMAEPCDSLEKVRKREYSQDDFKGYVKYLSGKLEDKKEKLKKLYEEYKSKNARQRERLRDRLRLQDSQLSDKKDYTLEDPLKIETWYFLTKEEARLHIQFDKYLESCPFIKFDSSPSTVIAKLGINENPKLQIFESLPKDLVKTGVQRKINQLRKLKEHETFVKLIKYLRQHNYRQWSACLSKLRARLKREKEFPDLDYLDDKTLNEGLSCYLGFFKCLPRSSDPSVHQHAEPTLDPNAELYYERRYKGILESWEIQKKDGLVYYSAFKELLKESGKLAIENLERIHHHGSSSAGSISWYKPERIAESVVPCEVQVENEAEMKEESERIEEMEEMDQEIILSKRRRESHYGSRHNRNVTIRKSWMDRIQSDIKAIEREIFRIESCIMFEDIQQGIFEPMEINDANERKNDYDDLKAPVLKHISFQQFLGSCELIKHDSSPTAIFEELNSRGCITVPPELALSCIELRIHASQILHQHEKYVSFLKDLVDYQPHIKWSDDIKKIHERLGAEDKLYNLSDYNIELGLKFFFHLLVYMEKPYHELIREGQRDDMLWIIDRICKIERRSLIKSWELTDDIDPIFDEVIKENILKERSSEAYKRAKEIYFLHEKFDSHLASSEFIKFDSSREELLEDKRLILKEYSYLPTNLIEESIDFRLRIMKKKHELNRYAEFLKHLVQCEYTKLSSNPDELLENAKYGSFSDLSKHYIIQGFLVCKSILSFVGESTDLDPMQLADFSIKMNGSFMLQVLEKSRYYDDPIYEMTFIELAEGVTI